MARVIAVGSIFMDLVALTDRHPKVGETVVGRDFQILPGGKAANQAIAARKAGADVLLYGRVGDDQFGTILLDYLNEIGIATDTVQVVPGGATGTGLIIVNSAGDNAIVGVPGVSATMTDADIFGIAFQPDDVVLSLFEAPTSVITTLFKAAHQAGAHTVLNAAPPVDFPEELAAAASTMVVNEHELAWYADVPSVDTGNRSSVEKLAKKIRHRDDQRIIVTLGDQGCMALEDDDTTWVATPKAKVVDTIGAGDCFIGNLAAKLAAKRPLEEALAWACAAASLSVERQGAAPSMPDPHEVEQRIGRG